MTMGAVFFWAPVTAISLLTQTRLSLAVGTLLPPAAFVAGYFITRKHVQAQKFVRAIAYWMFLGVLIFGPWFLGLGLMPTHGGFYEFDGWPAIKVVLLAMIFPILTLMFSLGHGTHHGIILSGLIALWLHRRFDREPRHATPQHL